MKEQPTLKMSFKGDWGRFPNKQIEKIARREICENEQSDSTLHCLRTCELVRPLIIRFHFSFLIPIGILPQNVNLSIGIEHKI